jgi:hypothetical protein
MSVASSLPFLHICHKDNSVLAIVDAYWNETYARREVVSKRIRVHWWENWAFFLQTPTPLPAYAPQSPDFDN